MDASRLRTYGNHWHIQYNREPQNLPPSSAQSSQRSVPLSSFSNSSQSKIPRDFSVTTIAGGLQLLPRLRTLSLLQQTQPKPQRVKTYKPIT